MPGLWKNIIRAGADFLKNPVGGGVHGLARRRAMETSSFGSRDSAFFERGPVKGLCWWLL
jgi:hypothetical protein